MEDYEVVDIANLGAENNYCQIQKECIDPSCVFCLEKKIAPSSPNTKKNEDSPNYKSIPEYKIIPNTDFIVDGFKYKTSACKNYFLSHFHSDHYTGLGKSFKEGTIYCSQITSRLIISELKVNPQFVVPIEMYKKHIVGGAEVILIDANHCPGAVCFLFKIGGKYYLHTGDFRFDRSAAHWQMLSTIPIEDNTFCSPRYIFPSQKDAIDEILSIAKQADALDTLFLVGSYTIGKERVYLSLAKSLNRKVLVTPQKYRILACLDLDMSLFTLNSTETNIHVLAMGQLSFKNLKELLLSYNGQYQRIVAFQVLEANFCADKPANGVGFRKRTYQNCKTDPRFYLHLRSEHSNFNELKEFVNWVNPKQLIPTVDFSSGKAQEVSELLFAKEKEEKRTAFSQFTSAITNIKQFITSCFTKQETISISEEGSSFQTQHDEAGEKGEDFDLEIIDPVLLNQQRWLLSQFEKNKPTITQTTTPTTSKKRSKNETETPRTTKKVKLNTAPTSGKFKQQSVLDFFCK